ncbi:MAG: hypothetical protein HKO59_12955 [Phycisphaerales bacterium]|nr:hypothetical protein [Phycisphaerae bacterium]NNF43950.1 hypothetical protein [Phycisphaerales bacterium]NNM26871.1 hypothetical protein [Phycisphaerales bacterium]
MPLTEMIDALADPPTRHAALVHLPVALSLFAIVPAAITLARGRNRAARTTAVISYAVLVTLAVITAKSGEAAEHELGAMADAAAEALEEHEELAERVWVFAAGGGVLFAVGWFLGTRPRLATDTLGVLAGLVTAGWMATTAHHGGVLVYDHGLGTPAAAAAPPDPDTDDAEPDDPRLVHFRTAVRPVFEEHCWRCHNPARKHRAGELDQTTMSGLLAGGVSGPAVVPGHPDGSLLMTAVRWSDPDLEMPPDSEQLSPDAIAAIETWIGDGAVWE